MRHGKLIALALVPALLLSACATTTTTSTTWGGPYGGDEWARYGHVESIRETVRRQEGNPAAGAVAGALVGGLLGSAIGGHVAYDAWGRAYRVHSGFGAAVGAVGGAMVGAAASQGASEDRTYEVFVQFDDGGRETFVYQGWLPFGVGDPVMLTPRGLSRW
jgi:outer membrane lipoprotein SlyB